MRGHAVKVEKVSGALDERCAVNVFSKKIDLGPGEVGTLALCVILKNPELDGVQRIFGDISEIAATKVEGRDGKYLDSVKDVVSSAQSYIKTHNLDCDLGVCLFLKDTCFVGKLGERVKIFVHKDGNTKELEIKFGSGPCLGGEIFALGSEKFFSTFDMDALASKAGVELEELIDELATEVSADDNQSELGAAFIEIRKSAHDTELENIAAVNAIEKEDEVPVSDEGIGVDTAPQDMPGGLRKKNKIDPLGFVFGVISKVFDELLRLRKGDIGAIFRLRRSLAIVAVIALVLICVSVFFTLKSQTDAKKLEEFNSYFKSASEKVEEADGVLELNKQRARDVLVSAQEDLVKALGIFPENSEALRLRDEVARRIKEAEEFSSLAFEEIADVAGAVSVAKSGDEIAVFFQSKISTYDDSGDLTGETGTDSNILDGTVGNNIGYFTSGDGLMRLSLDGAEETEIEKIDGALDIGTFISNVYVLVEDQILKYVPTADGLVRGGDYLVDDESFSSSARMAIDGSVWVADGEVINKYTRGEKESFELSGLSQKPRISEIYTDPELENIYLLDRSNAAVLVFDKNGNYKLALQSQELGNAQGLVVVSDELLYVISSGWLLRANISQ